MTAPATTRPDLPRKIGFWGAVAVMVGIIIGTGIFKTPTSIAKELSDPWLVLVFWLVGGVLSLFGAFTYAELAVMFPQSGGVYVFIREGFGRCAAFVFGWTYMLISKPVAAAGIAIIFAEQVNTLLDVNWDKRPATIAIMFALTWINARGVGLGTGFAGILTVVKVLALLAIAALAFALGKGDAAGLAAEVAPRSLLLAIAPVMGLVLWTYDGWSDVGAIAGEVKDPQRKLPSIYFVGTAAITLLYLAVNAAYLWVVPLQEMRTTDNVAPLVIDRLLGKDFAIVVTVIVLISSLGSTHGSIMTGARVTFAQARDGLLFAFLAKVHSTRETPAVSLWFQFALSSLAVIFLKTFENLAGAFVFTMWIFYAMAGASIFILRRRLPDAPRAYRCWGYPVVPALFIASALVMTVLSIMESREKTLPWIAVLLAGIPVYYLWQRATQRTAQER